MKIMPNGYGYGYGDGGYCYCYCYGYDAYPTVLLRRAKRGSYEKYD